jgi:uncharacterized membrane protein YkgB
MLHQRTIQYGFLCKLSSAGNPGKARKAASQSLPTEAKFVTSLLRAKATALERVGVQVSRYGLVLTLLLIGALKFTADEAHVIQPLVASSPLMSWLYRIFSVQAVSKLIGAIEIAVAVLIALRPFSAKLSFIGSIGAIITFVLTVSFLFSTPGAFQFSHGFPLLGDAGHSSSRILFSWAHRSGLPRKLGKKISSHILGY